MIKQQNQHTCQQLHMLHKHYEELQSRATFNGNHVYIKLHIKNDHLIINVTYGTIVINETHDRISMNT